jgi:hypothetical protein
MGDFTAKNVPVAIIYPEGGEPLYEEEGSGLRLTASDFIARNGEIDISTKKVKKSDRRTARPDDNPSGASI